MAGGVWLRFGLLELGGVGVRVRLRLVDEFEPGFSLERGFMMMFCEFCGD